MAVSRISERGAGALPGCPCPTTGQVDHTTAATAAEGDLFCKSPEQIRIVPAHSLSLCAQEHVPSPSLPFRSPLPCLLLLLFPDDSEMTTPASVQPGSKETGAASRFLYHAPVSGQARNIVGDKAGMRDLSAACCCPWLSPQPCEEPSWSGQEQLWSFFPSPPPPPILGQLETRGEGMEGRGGATDPVGEG